MGSTRPGGGHRPRPECHHATRDRSCDADTDADHAQLDADRHAQYDADRHHTDDYPPTSTAPTPTTTPPTPTRSTTPTPKPTPTPTWPARPKPPMTTALTPYKNVVLRPGATGAAVKTLQRALGLHGPYGRFDKTTERAVRTFQTVRHLPRTGVVNRATWNAAEKTASPAVAPHDRVAPGQPRYGGQGPAARVEAPSGRAIRHADHDRRADDAAESAPARYGHRHGAHLGRHRAHRLPVRGTSLVSGVQPHPRGHLQENLIRRMRRIPEASTYC